MPASAVCSYPHSRLVNTIAKLKTVGYKKIFKLSIVAVLIFVVILINYCNICLQYIKNCLLMIKIKGNYFNKKIALLGKPNFKINVY
jgi:hypothetical protein